MTFLHIAFLGGSLAVVVPIVLHLLMRQQPKHLEFPALRFIKKRQTANRRQMRVRHWLLLALRTALILLLAVALARPSILASGVLGDQEAPVAAAFIFDTNPRMQYRQQNQTRLQVAQDTAHWLLPQLPAESDVAVVDSHNGAAAFAVDRGAARQRIDRLDAGGASEPLGVALHSALKLVSESEKPRKEIYVFTDLTRAAWNAEAMRDFTNQLAELRGTVGVYLIDVGAAKPTNSGVADLHLSSEVLSKNSLLHVNVDLAHDGDDAERGLELFVGEGPGETPSLRGRKSVSFKDDEAQRTDFSVRGLTTGVHQGYVKLSGEDPLAVDDVRWFTVEVRPAWRVLLVAPGDAKRQPADYAFFVSEALAPHDIRVRGEAAFECDVIGADRLAAAPLTDYAAICLIDPRPLPGSVWQQLHSYVTAGGGLGIVLGRNATPVEKFNEPIVQELLPGKLVRHWKSADGVSLAPDTFQHPILAKFRELGNAIPWKNFPVFRHWQLGDLTGDAAVVLAYSNNKPALVERAVGKGRVLTMTTPLSDPASGDDIWNVIPTGEDPLAFFLLANGMLHYLVGSGQERLNYAAGVPAVLHPSGAAQYPIYSLTTPRGDHIRTPLDAGQNAVVVTSTEMPGNYRLEAGPETRRADLGFSINLPTDVSRLERAGPDDLKQVFGDTEYRLAHNRDEINRSVSAGRVGQELFPYLIVLLALVLGCEQVLSNRFYQDHDNSKKRSLAAKWAARIGSRAREPKDMPVGPS